MKKTPLIVLCGPSASGKTTIANLLSERLGLRRAITTTTRDRRQGEDPSSYHWVTPGGFPYNKVLEYDIYNGHKYGLTREECNISDIVIVTPPGVKAMRNHCEKHKRKCVVFLFDVSRKHQAERMVLRGDSRAVIESRVKDDDIVYRSVPLNGLYDILLPDAPIEQVYKVVYDAIIFHGYTNWGINIEGV